MNTNIKVIRSAKASLVGSMIEWYDYFLYGTASALIFNRLFFPTFDPLVGTLLAFASFGVGFLARPLGGIIFGHFGDRFGRKKALVVTLWIMGGATFLIGLLPSYDTIGPFAPAILILLRIVQGFGVGGEWGGAVLFTWENAPDGKRGFFGAVAQLGVPLGMGLATLVFGFFSLTLSEEALLSWGWRIPFLLSLVLVFVGYYIRVKMEETNAFMKIEKSSKIVAYPTIAVFKNTPLQLLKAIGARIAENGTFYIFSTFILTYATQIIGLPRNTILATVMVAIVLDVITIPFFGKLSDKYGRRPIYLFGCAFAAVMAFPFFWLTDSSSILLIQISLILTLSIAHAAMYSVQGSMLPEMFASNIRYSGISLASQIASVIAGGLSPFLATLLLALYGSWAVSLYIIVMALITFVSVYFIKETAYVTNDELHNL